MSKNFLSEETSPYLLQHQNNPVYWYGWSEEPFKIAKKEDKPILLSIGYASCHWCHVMAHESFEDIETAKIMNEKFINIKLDREERPDIDSIYQTALALLGQQGGWPLTMFLDSSILKKGLKTSSRIPSGIPGPSSSMIISTKSSRFPTLKETCSA